MREKLLCTALGMSLSLGLVIVPAFAQAGDVSGLGISQEKSPPNIIFIMLDDLDYFDLPSYGNTALATPNIDQMVAEGMRLTDYYAGGPLCPPTRNSLLTGNFPIRHGIKRLPPDSTKGIPAEALTLPQILQGYGYATAHVGKWHVGHRHAEFLPSQKGYDTSLVGEGYTGRVQPNYRNPRLMLDEGPPFTSPKHATEALTDFAIDFIDANRSNPFFINLWYFSPHRPLECPPGFEPDCLGVSQQDTDIRTYRAMIANTDQQIGRILDRIAALGLDDNTLIVVTSDNGGVAGSTHATPPPGQSLRGGKTKVFERGIRVPFIAWAPGLVPAGTVNDSVVVSLDMLPTFEQLTRPDGIEIRIPFDGMSALPVLTSNTSVERPDPLFWEHNFRDNDNYQSPTGWFQNFAVREGDFKLVMEKNEDWMRPRLYDVAVNPAETQDLTLAYPHVADKLLEEYWAWRKRTSSLPFFVQSSSGSVTHTSDKDGVTFQFGDAGGQAELSESKLFDFGEGDFSASMRVRLDQGGTKPVLAVKPGSWILSLTANNKLKLRLLEPLAPGATTPNATVIVSNGRLLLGQEHDIAFTIAGFRSDNSTVKMYVDGVLQAQSSDALSRIEIVEEPVRVGNNYQSPPNRPFVGMIEDLKFYLNVLTQEEVDALDR